MGMIETSFRIAVILLIAVCAEAVEGPDQDSLLTSAGAELFERLLESDPEGGDGYIRMRYRVGEGIQLKLKTGFRAGLSYGRYDDLQSSGEVEAGSVLEWKNAGLHIISGLGTVHIGDGIVTGRSMGRSGVRMSRNAVKGKVKIRGDPALWNDEIRGLIVKGGRGSLYYADYGVGRSLAFDGGQGQGAALHRISGKGRFILETWTYVGGGDGGYVKTGFSISGNAFLNHLLLAGGLRQRDLDLGLQLLLLPEKSAAIDRDANIGTYAEEGRAVIGSGFWRRLDSRLELGMYLLLSYGISEGFRKKVIAECSGRSGSIKWRLQLQSDREDSYEEGDVWPYAEYRELADRRVLSCSSDLPFPGGGSYRVQLQTEPGGWSEAAMMQRIRLPLGEGSILFQHTLYRTAETVFYLARPYVGGIYTAARLQGMGEYADLSLKRTVAGADLSLSISLLPEDGRRMIVQLHKDLE